MRVGHLGQRRWGLMLLGCGATALLLNLNRFHRPDQQRRADCVADPSLCPQLLDERSVVAAPSSQRAAVPDAPGGPLADEKLSENVDMLESKNRALEESVAALNAEVAALKAAAATVPRDARSSRPPVALTTVRSVIGPVVVPYSATIPNIAEDDTQPQLRPGSSSPVTRRPPLPPGVAAAPMLELPISPHAGKGAAAEAQADSAEQARRTAAIKAAVQHSFNGYKRRAWGRDDVKPISGNGADGKFRHAVTLVDSLDTLWLLGLRAEFNESVVWCKENLPARFKTLSRGTSAFETIIRTLGGLEGAHALSQDPELLKLATQLGDRLIEIVQPDGSTPYAVGGGSGGMGCPSLAESGTSQLEYNYLSNVTGEPTYASRSNKFYDTISAKLGVGVDGLMPNCWSRPHVKGGLITMGADGDSYYEYLLKGWLQTGRTDRRLWDMYNAAVDGMLKRMVVRNPEDGLTYLAIFHWPGGHQEHVMEHLACFVPGWLILGAQYQPDPARQAAHVKLAEELAYTCWQMYEQQPTGIGPERVKRMKMDLSVTDTREYILRPEALEGWWYMWELTGDPKYREWGWKAFTSFEKHLKVQHGYASLKDVRDAGRGHIDKMESFWVAETLKYAYLLQDPSHPIRVDKFVMNTEAHPLPVGNVPWLQRGPA